MPKASDLFRGAVDDNPLVLKTVAIRGEPVMLRLFTDEYEDVSLHYENDDAVRGYLVCPGRGCPLCHLGNAPQLSHLFAVYNFETRAVEVLRVPASLGPGSLFSQLRPLFMDPGVADKLVTIAGAKGVYAVRSRELAATVDRGTAAITAYVDAAKAGLKLRSAFAVMTAKDLACVARIRVKLEALGDYAAPTEEGLGAAG